MIGLLGLLLYCPVMVAAAPIEVTVTIAPLAWMVEQIAGTAVDVKVLVPEGHVPESTQPAPRAMAALHHTDLAVLVGHPAFTFETRIVDPVLSKRQAMRSVNLYRIALALYPSVDIDQADPHLWTSPRVMGQACVKLARQMAALDPDHAGNYLTRSNRLVSRIDALMEDFQARLDKLPSRRFLVYHPAWGAFARDFGLQQVAIEQEGKIPGPARLARLFDDNIAASDGVIIVSPGHAARDAELLARQHGLRVFVVDPLKRNWFAMMHDMMDALTVAHD